MALIDISCIFSEFTTTGEFPWFISNYTVCYNCSVGIKKTKEVYNKKEIPTVALFSFSRNFTDSVFLQLIPIEIDPVNSGVLGETAGENEEKIVKTSQSITQILLNTAAYIKKNSRKTFLDIMVIKNKITSQVNRFPLKINDRLSD